MNTNRNSSSLNASFLFQHSNEIEIVQQQIKNALNAPFIERTLRLNI